MPALRQVVLRFAPAALLAVCAAGCADPDASVHLVIDGELRPGVDFDRLVAKAEHLEDPSVFSAESISASELQGLPYSINFLQGPRTPLGSQLRLSVQALQADLEVSAASGKVTLDEGITQLTLQLPALPASAGARDAGVQSFRSPVARSDFQPVVQVQPPSNTVRPTVTGEATEGQVLTAEPGTWQGTAPITFAYQWLSCDSAGAGCAALPAATGASIQASSSEVGRTLRARVSASNAAGDRFVDSQQTPVVQPGPPTNTALPTVSGLARVANPLVGTAGSWTGTGLAYAYQWLRCDAAGASCAAIAGATTPSFAAGNTELGFTLRLRVQASNAVGAVWADSAPTAGVDLLLVATRASWKYLDDGSDQGTAWRAPAFADAGWVGAVGILGYGDTYVNTVLSFGPNSNSKYITTYFRKSFNVSNPAQVTGLLLRAMYDDGFVVYLNGTEIRRASLPAGAITFSTLAVNHEAVQTYELFDLSASAGLLVSGANVLAVEVHQTAITSSDLIWDAELVAR